MAYIYITCSRGPLTLQKIRSLKRIEFSDFDVYKAWQFSKYNVRRDPIFEVETLMLKRWEAQPLTTLAGSNWPLTTKLVFLLGY